MDFNLLLLALAPLLIVAQVWFLVRKMSKPEKILKHIEGGLSTGREEIIAKHMDWLNSQGMERLTSFQFSAIQSVVFQQKGTQRFLIFHFHQRNTFEMETRFTETSHLETSNSGSSGMFPARPGVYKQSYPDLPVDQLWQRHLEGEAYLLNKFSINWEPLGKPYEEILVNSLRLTMNYVRSIPFYPFRALYWFFITRQTVKNRSVQQQFP